MKNLNNSILNQMKQSIIYIYNTDNITTVFSKKKKDNITTVILLQCLCFIM